MKGFLLGDIHLGVHPLSEDKWLEIHTKYFYEFLFPILETHYKQGDKLIILGDLFDNRNYITLRVISFALDIFNYLEEKNIEIISLIGNHDMYNSDNYKHTSLRILEKHKNIQIINEPTVLDFGKKCLFLSWINQNKDEHNILKQYAGKVDYLFCHSDLNGAKTNLKTSLKSGITMADFVLYPKVFAGHIHLHQTIDNFTYVGCLFHMDRNDKDNKKGLSIVDFESGKTKFIENNMSPEFRTIEIKDESDIYKLDEIQLTQTDFVDLVVYNSLLLNNKVIGRKIEQFTKNNTISSLLNVDDTKQVEINFDIENIGIDISIEDVMRNYIESQDYEQNVIDDMKKILEDSIKISKMNQ